MQGQFTVLEPSLGCALDVDFRLSSTAFAQTSIPRSIPSLYWTKVQYHVIGILG
ncbi:MAG: hypothetical protein ACREQV_27140 [Candidatus Binatia bacterium]